MDISMFFTVRNFLEKRKMKDALSRASDELSVTQESPEVIRVITNVLTEILPENNMAVYLLNSDRPDRYVLSKSRFEQIKAIPIKDKHPIIARLKRQKFLAYDDTRRMLDTNSKNIELRAIISKMKELSADMIFPCVHRDKLWAFIILGEHQKKKAISVDALKTLSTLVDQTAVAVRNCHYIEAKENLLKEDVLKKRSQSSEVAGSMVQAINDPLCIFRSSLYVIKNFFLNNKIINIPKKIKDDVEKSIEMSCEATDKIAAIVKAVINYSQLESDKLQPFWINDAAKECCILIQPQVKEEQAHFIKQVECNLPPVLGDQVLCEEVLMNFAINALHAVQESEEKKIFLKIFRKNEKTIRIECVDNGYGIQESMLEDIFLPYTTSKGSEEWDGLGLYRVNKIVEIFQGKVWAESKGEGQGAKFVIELPVYKEIC